MMSDPNGFQRKPKAETIFLLFTKTQKQEYNIEKVPHQIPYSSSTEGNDIRYQ